MTLSELAHVEDTRSGEVSAVRPIYFFVHVPKCAGTTLRRHFEKHLGKRYLTVPRRESLLRNFGGSHADLHRARVDTGALDVIGGHSMSQSLRNLFPEREIREAVLLRDPLSLIVSFYNYRNRKFREAGKGEISFSLFRRSLPINPVSRFFLNRYLEIGYPRILGLSSHARFELIDRTLERFWFVGSWRYCSDLVASISRNLQISTSVESENISSGPRLRVEDLPDRERRLILSENALDQAIFDKWKDACLSHAPAPVRPVLPRYDHSAHISRELARNLVYPVMRAQQRLRVTSVPSRINPA